MRTGPAPLVIAILACPEAGASALYGMFDLLASAGQDGEPSVKGTPAAGPLRPRILSRDGEPTTMAHGVRLTPDGSFADFPDPDLVCIPELVVPQDLGRLGGLLGDEVDWLRRGYAQGATLAAAGSGAVLLAEAGLLDGQPATTHWTCCERMQKRYPRVRLQSQKALVVAGEGQRLVMSGGGATWMDMALLLIARLLDVDAAMRVARLNLIDWRGVGRQPFASSGHARQQDDALIGQVQAWIAQHYDVPRPVAAMAAHSGLPERSFERRFHKATGMTPLEYVHTLRLEQARQQLETSAWPIEAIAGGCGYGDAGYFSRLFARRMGLTPSQYRRRFGALQQVPAP
ncbi:GlxA family transcriptional regulator [Agrilutibacter solisilvae]|uniref:Helix-turn-helix domain-containing protein n=1 Tax=Agrilutibacter solisilvae TaxID=2763317 RepID=A0A974XYK1_9GAMM|nr:helix-turn-helix domain-containing protein [Lysobacter solisilvae]QSX78171.1 helix-turn-helix domain-containing protein [Lysobacter solisilvae]